jgi:hypothetical protein
VDNPNDLQRFFLWIVHNPVFPVGFHQPEAQRQRRQVLANTSGAGSIRQEGASRMDRLLDPVGRIKVVPCDVAPNFK